MVSKMKCMEIKVDELVPLDKNPRLHSSQQVEELKKNIILNGQYQEIVVDEGKNVLIGNARLQALKELGFSRARCVMISGQTEKEKKKLILSDNKIFSLGSFKWETEREYIMDINEIDIPGYDNGLLQLVLEQDSGFDAVDKFKSIADQAPKAQAQRPTAGDIISSANEGQPAIVVETGKTIITCPHCGGEIEL